MVGHIISLDSIAQKEVIAPAELLVGLFFFFFCFFRELPVDRRGLMDNSKSYSARECGLNHV